MPKIRVFIDSFVLIRGFIYEESNSSIILDMILKGDLTGILNPKVLTETKNVLKSIMPKDFVSFAFSIIHSVFEIIPIAKYHDTMEKLRNQIKEKDLEHLATVRALNITNLIAFDRDFEGIKEYITPTKFLQSIGVHGYETEF